MANRSRIAADLKTLLLEFSVSALVEMPCDLVQYAVDYFGNLKKQQEHATNVSESDSSSECSTASLQVGDIPTLISGGPRLPLEKEDSSSATSLEYSPSSEVFPKTKPEIWEIRKSIQHCFIFRALGDVQIQALIDCMKPKLYQAGQIVFKAKEQGYFFYVVGSGTYEAYVTKLSGSRHLLATYHNRGCFGELMDDRPRSCTVRAITAGRLWTVSKKAFLLYAQKIVSEKRTHYRNLLKMVNELESLNATAMDSIADALVPIRFESGKDIITQGEIENGELYFIENGDVAVIRQGNNEGEKIVTNINVQGNFFGVAKGERAPATYKATMKTKVAYLDGDCVENLLEKCLDKIQWHSKVQLAES